jgi:hypothetical protein
MTLSQKGKNWTISVPDFTLHTYTQHNIKYSFSYIAIWVLNAQSDTLSIERFSRNRQCTFALATHTRFFLQSQL